MERFKVIKDFDDFKINDIIEGEANSADSLIRRGLVKAIRKVSEEEEDKQIEESEGYKAAAAAKENSDEYSGDNYDKIQEKAREVSEKENYEVNSLDVLKSAIGGLEDKKINWVDTEVLKNGGDWEKSIKPLLNLALNNGAAYDEDRTDLFFIAHSNDRIKGKVQLIEQHKQRLPLVKRFLKSRDVTEWNEAENKYVKTSEN